MARHMVGLRQFHSYGSLNHFYEAVILIFLWSVIFVYLPGSEFVFGISQGLPHFCFFISLVLSLFLVISGSSHICTCISWPRWILAKTRL